MRRGAVTSVVAIAAGVTLVIAGAPSGAARPGPLACAARRGPRRPSRRSRAPAGSTTSSAASVTDAWAVGSRYDPGDREGHTLIEHHDGTSSTITPSADGPSAPQSKLSGVAARTATDAWAVGSYAKANNLIRTLVERWDGSSWTRVKSPNARAARRRSAERRRGACRRRRLGRRVVRAGRAQPDPDRALGRERVVGRAQPEQGTVSERFVRHRCRGTRRHLGGRDVVHEGVRRPDPHPPLGRRDVEPRRESERGPGLGSERPGVGVGGGDRRRLGGRSARAQDAHDALGRHGVGRESRVPRQRASPTWRPSSPSPPTTSGRSGGSWTTRRTPSARSSNTGTAPAGRSWRAPTRGRATTISGGSPRPPGACSPSATGSLAAGPARSSPLSLERCVP